MKARAFRVFFQVGACLALINGIGEPWWSKMIQIGVAVVLFAMADSQGRALS